MGASNLAQWRVRCHVLPSAPCGTYSHMSFLLCGGFLGVKSYSSPSCALPVADHGTRKPKTNPLRKPGFGVRRPAHGGRAPLARVHQIVKRRPATGGLKHRPAFGGMTFGGQTLRKKTPATRQAQVLRHDRNGTHKANCSLTTPLPKSMPSHITVFLQGLLDKALAAATWRKGRIFLSLFAGTDPIGAVFEFDGGAVVRFDTAIDARLDLEDSMVQEVILRWGRSGIVWASFLGTHCRTFSLASYSKGPGWYNSYRTVSNPWGELAKLGVKQQALVLAGNNHATFSVNFLRLAAAHGIKAGMENPKGSVLFKLPLVQAIPKEMPGKAFTMTCDYCQYGKPWQKGTTVLWVGVHMDLAPHKCCGAPRGGKCSRTNRPHKKLGNGRMDAKTGKRMTKVAEPYPWPLAKAFALCLDGRCEGPNRTSK